MDQNLLTLFLNVYYSSRLDYLVPGAYKRVLIRSNAHALCVHVLYAYTYAPTMGAYFVVYVRLHLYTHMRLITI